jgi:PAT family beta-lactamase induction signal transducer AmpG
MVIVGLIMAALTIYNFFLHLEQKTPKRRREIVGTQSKFWAVFASFFKKKQIGFVLPIIRLGESQLLKMLTSFLLMTKVLVEWA